MKHRLSIFVHLAIYWNTYVKRDGDERLGTQFANEARRVRALGRTKKEAANDSQFAVADEQIDLTSEVENF